MRRQKYSFSDRKRERERVEEIERKKEREREREIMRKINFLLFHWVPTFL